MDSTKNLQELISENDLLKQMNKSLNDANEIYKRRSELYDKMSTSYNNTIDRNKKHIIFLQNKIKQLEKEIPPTDKTTPIFDTINNKLLECNHDLNMMTQKNEDLERKLNECNERNNFSQEELVTEKVNTTQLKSQLEKITEQLNECKQELQKCIDTKPEFTETSATQWTRLTEELENTINELDNVSKELDKCKKNDSQFKDYFTVEQLNGQIALLKEENDELTKNITDCSEANNKLRKDLSIHELEIKNYKTKNEELEEINQDLKDNNDQYRRLFQLFNEPRTTPSDSTSDIDNPLQKQIDDYTKYIIDYTAWCTNSIEGRDRFIEEKDRLINEMDNYIRNQNGEIITLKERIKLLEQGMSLPTAPTHKINLNENNKNKPLPPVNDPLGIIRGQKIQLGINNKRIQELEKQIQTLSNDKKLLEAVNISMSQIQAELEEKIKQLESGSTPPPSSSVITPPPPASSSSIPPPPSFSPPPPPASSSSSVTPPIPPESSITELTPTDDTYLINVYKEFLNSCKEDITKCNETQKILVDSISDFSQNIDKIHTDVSINKLPTNILDSFKKIPPDAEINTPDDLRDSLRAQFSTLENNYRLILESLIDITQRPPAYSTSTAIVPKTSKPEPPKTDSSEASGKKLEKPAGPSMTETIKSLGPYISSISFAIVILAGVISTLIMISTSPAPKNNSSSSSTSSSSTSSSSSSSPSTTYNPPPSTTSTSQQLAPEEYTKALVQESVVEATRMNNSYNTLYDNMNVDYRKSYYKNMDIVSLEQWKPYLMTLYYLLLIVFAISLMFKNTTMIEKIKSFIVVAIASNMEVLKMFVILLVIIFQKIKEYGLNVFMYN